MKFSCSVIVNKPKDTVVSYFMNPDHLVHWQDGFLGKEHKSGEPLEEGAVSEFRYKVGGNELQIYETIISNQMPDSFLADYDCEPTQNTMLSSFQAIDGHSTKFNVEVEYLKFSGFMVIIMKTLFPSMFMKQVQKWLDNFKEFVENDAA